MSNISITIIITNHVGRARGNSMCVHDLVSTVVIHKGLITSTVITHELGHTLVTI